MGTVSGFLFAFSTTVLPCIIYDMKRDYSIPPLHSTTPLVGSPLTYCRRTLTFSTEKKLEWCGYLMVKKFDVSRFDTILECDGQTDGRTSCDSIVRDN